MLGDEVNHATELRILGYFEQADPSRVDDVSRGPFLEESFDDLEAAVSHRLEDGSLAKLVGVVHSRSKISEGIQSVDLLVPGRGKEGCLA